MKALLFTNEYPPHVYGGAGVHVDYLSRELARRIEVEVRCFGDQHQPAGPLRVRGFSSPPLPEGAPKHLKSVFEAIQQSLNFNQAGIEADVVHCHTWYTHFAGLFAKLAYGKPLVITVHSLEPLRPWKREQLGGGYDFSSWVERTALEAADAVVAVSEGTREDVRSLFRIAPERLHVIHNGIDTEEYRPRECQTDLAALGLRPDRPFVLFVGRITRQKGIIHLVRAIERLDEDFDIVLCAGAPDTPEIGVEMKEAVARVSEQRSGVLWIDRMLDRPAMIDLYNAASLFCCPSVYEPFGIINLEAMACQTPVVASMVGGIPEVVIHGETGLLVPLVLSGEVDCQPLDPDRFARDLAFSINRLMRQPEEREAMGRKGRQRAMEVFAWSSIAARTEALYRSLLPTSLS